MRILVTGATGFIGRHFVEGALIAGHQIAGLIRPRSAEKQEVIEELKARGAELFVGDVADRDSLQNAMAGVDVVCHFASAFRESDVPDDYFLSVNVQGTRNVLEVAAEHGVGRFIYCSTVGIYGKRIEGVVNEKFPLHPWNIYERSKVAAEEVVRELSAKHDIERVIMRPAVVYGPYDKRLLKMFRGVAQGRFPLFGAGQGRRHMVYVGDVIDACLRASVVPDAAGREMIIAGPRAIPLRELLDTLASVAGRRRFGPRLPLWPMLMMAAGTEDVCKVIGVKPPIYRRRMDFYLNDAAFDSNLATEVLGWEPTVDIEEGFDRTIQSYEAANWIH